MDAQQRISDATDVITGTLDELTQQAQEKTEAIQDLDVQITEAQNKILDLAKDYEQKQLALATELEAPRKSLEILQAELVDTEDKLKEAKVELEATIKHNSEFVAYEARSNKALAAREASLMAREKDMEDELIRLQRRGSILKHPA